MIRRRGLVILTIVISLSASLVMAQDQVNRTNLVTSHRMQMDESGYTHIDFTLREVPDKAMLSFDVRFAPQFV